MTVGGATTIAVAALAAGWTGCGGNRSDTECWFDTDCAFGSEWCVGGQCVACDDSTTTCTIDCPAGWSRYTRNGCHPCVCAPPNQCTSDVDCPSPDGLPRRCYAGAFCWDWCEAGSPECCYGNVCSRAGCGELPPLSCEARGCPVGQTCTQDEAACTFAGAECNGSAWNVTGICGHSVCR